MNKSIYRLIVGFKKFREKFFLENATGSSRFQKLVTDGQTPKTLLIGCSDSRVDPAILTDASPGELFVVRNVANLIPPCEPSAVGFHGTSSAIEFAVVNLKVENIIVLGHRHCGGIRALMTGSTEKPDSFVGQWMSIAQSCKQKVLSHSSHLHIDEQCKLAEMESIKHSLDNLRTFPFVQEAINQGQLSLIGIYFDLEQGELFELNETSGTFTPLQL